MSEPSSPPSATPPSSAPAASAAADARTALRQRLLQARSAWAETPHFAPAQQRVQAQLMRALEKLEPHCLGVYWPLAGEFNPRDAALQAKALWGCRLALPFARKTPREMQFLAWDGETPVRKDECGIWTAQGEPLVPDIVLVPCLGFTDEGFRLGYGGGYFDRYLAAHPEVTAVGLGWTLGRLTEAELNPQPHDQPLVGVITEDDT